MTYTTDDASILRQRLVDELIQGGFIASPGVQAAFRTVPRHLFAPEVSLEEAYTNDTVRTKRDGAGVTISSVSAPWLQAVMLEQAAIVPGMRCLEIGSGGYNAALMAELAGPGGQVTTVDIDADIVDRAKRFLSDAGYDRVSVAHADAEHGVPEDAPFDRIIVTVGVWDLPPAWVDQLFDRGRIVVPLRLRGLSRSVAFQRDGERLVSLDHQMAGFVDVQGEGAHPERLIPLHEDDVVLRVDDDPVTDADALRAALAQSRVPVWSGVRFGESEPFDMLFLWLATCLSDFCLLGRNRSEIARALVDPASPIGTPTLLGKTSFAYLTYREVETERYEFGAHGHGPQAEELAMQLAAAVCTWDGEHRHGAPARICVHPAGASIDPPSQGRVIHKRHTTVTIAWP